MPLSIQPARSEVDIKLFTAFPWTIYRADPYWVPPILEDRLGRLGFARNPFWRNASRELWLARRDGRVVGTIAAILDENRVRALGEPVGSFGFFECLPDQEAAQGLVQAAAGWLGQNGMRVMRGPYNPSGEDECGILVEGFKTRPAVMEAHTPPYYQGLIEGSGMVYYRDMVARMYCREPGGSREEQIPAKLLRVAQAASQRPDLRLRTINMRSWDSEMELAWRIYTYALSSLPEYVPISLEEFRAMGDGLKAVLDPRLALVAEISGEPVGYVLAVPDINEALQKVLSRKGPRRLNPLVMLRLIWQKRRLSRISFKILMILPAYQGRGIEAVLVEALSRAVWEIGYREVDMSLTGDENEKSNRLQENLGFHVYRRYRIYQKEIA